MKKKALAFLKFVFSNFGSLVIFYGVYHFYGTKPAIAVTTAFAFLDVAYKIVTRQKITQIFIFTTVLTLIFGAVDLYAQHSFLFQYESTITNVFTGIFFGYSLFAERSMIQEYYEKSANPKPMTRPRIIYLRLLTAVWTLYFFLKAAAYYWAASRYSIDQGLVIRSVFGTGSLVVLLVISIFGSKKIFPLMQKWKILPAA